MNRYNAKRLLVAFAMTGLAGGAHAGGPAFSGLFASADSAETVYNNPAGMARLDGRHLTNQVIFIIPMSEFEVDEDLTTTEGGNPRKPDSAFVPAVYYQDEFADDWRWGVSLNVPSGFGSNNGPNWAGRYYSDEFTLAYVALSPALAYKVTKKFPSGRASALSTRVRRPAPELIMRTSWRVHRMAALKRSPTGLVSAGR